MANPGPNLRREGRILFTRNARPGHRVYGEELRSFDGVEHRLWDPWRSKLAAYLLRDGPSLELDRCRRALYLGGAHGTTVSHLADLIDPAPVFVVEKSPASFAPLLAFAESRPNVLPILADAHLPERYDSEVGIVDLLYQDVAQRDQTAIFLENARACLDARGIGLFMLKVRSVTQRRSVAEVLQETRRELAHAGWTIRYETDLAPFARDHRALLVGR
ncbi:MAG TPA: fibrillarin-like rRNA/tRNA 2'-O-methyltransferase [Thermoplasmata archaeon]|nr:fibrillarin-like rRNA/tRNA 2'-O-methyltransferase [Thermoplasmata archaeon]